MVAITTLRHVDRKSEPSRALTHWKSWHTLPYSEGKPKPPMRPLEALWVLSPSLWCTLTHTCSFSAIPRTPKHRPTPRPLYVSGPPLGYGCPDSQSPSASYLNPPPLSNALLAPWKQSSPPVLPISALPGMLYFPRYLSDSQCSPLALV